MSKGDFLVLRGVLNYAKVIGPARPHTGLPKYDKGPFWSLDLSPDKKSMDLLDNEGLTRGGKRDTGKLRKPDMKKDKARAGATLASGEVIPADAPFISLKVLENRSDGTKNAAPTIKDLKGNLWDNGLIGNGTVADVKVKVVDYDGAEKGVYLQAIRVLDHVPYETDDFEPVDEDDEYFARPEKDGEDKPSEEIDEDLDDDVPF